MLIAVNRIISDFCGGSSETLIKNNYAAILEVIDEIFDYGQIQTTSTDDIKPFIKSDTSGIKTVGGQITAKISKLRSALPYQLLSSAESVSGSSSHKSISDESNANNIFIDIGEHVSMTIGRKKEIISCEIEGTITSKSFLPGTVELKLGFLQNIRTSEQLLNQSSTSTSTSSTYSSNSNSISNVIRSGDIILEDALFDSVVDYRQFEVNKQIYIPSLPIGEVNIMRYRIIGNTTTQTSISDEKEKFIAPTSSPFKQPISQSSAKSKIKSSSSSNNDVIRSMDIKSPVQVHIQLKEVSKHTLEIFIRLIPNLHDSESNLSITRFLCILPLPSSVANVTFQSLQKSGSYIGLDMLSSGDDDLSESGSNPKIGEMCQYRSEERQALWQAAPFRQGEEPSVVIRITSDEDTNMSTVWKRRLGPLYCDFTIPDYTASGAALKFLVVSDGSKSFAPLKWMRKMTYSGSYVVRI
ncbi:MAG: putative Mu homology domain [Streblomastix strix]|uniref:Putative Mu homology domain n=1 Tax=Streblomastix strix TaxID=222440 RepID=A0A5J4VD06_9EUKA|nr:MAG: putative Mu homology domain [Streblomastix strix]